MSKGHEIRLERKAGYKHADTRQTVIYQTLDDLNYEPPGNISAKSGEEKKISKPQTTCRVTKVSIACSHDIDEDEGTKPKKSSAEKKGDAEHHAVRVDPKNYATVPYQVVAPVNQSTANKLAKKHVHGTGDLAKWFREEVFKQETITLTVEGYFCEEHHPKVTVRQVGQKDTSDTTTEGSTKDEDVTIYDGKPPAKDEDKNKKNAAKKKSPAGGEDSGSDAKEKSSVPVLTSTEKWFYVGSLQPKYDPMLSWLLRFLYPRWVRPNLYQIKIETCGETRVLHVEAYYNAVWKLEFARSAAIETDDEDDMDWDPFIGWNESVEKLQEEAACWNDTFGSDPTWGKVPRVLDNLFKNYKVSLKMEGQGARINPQIDGDTIMKIVEFFTKWRENREKRQEDGHTDHEFLHGHELTFKLLEGSVASNWRQREHAGRRVGWYHDLAINLNILEIEYAVSIGYSPFWMGSLEIKGTGKLALTASVKGKLSTDSKDRFVAYWKPRAGKVIAWFQEEVFKKPAEDKDKDDIALKDELAGDIREGIPLVFECKPEIAMEIPVFMEELFNMTPKIEGGAAMGGFLGYDDDGPCIRAGIEVRDVEVSLEISALGGWISFTVGPIPIIETEKYFKNFAKKVEKEFGFTRWDEGQFRLPKIKTEEPASTAPAPSA